MNNKNFQTFFDCSYSKIRAGTINKNKPSEAYFAESKFFKDHSSFDSEIQKIVASFEKITNEYIDNVNLMIDSQKMLSIGISIFKKFDGLKLKQENIQFLIQDAKQQVLKYYSGYNIAHIIINNYKIDGVDYTHFPNETKCNLISLDILFICLPNDIVLNFKEFFFKSNISVDQIICSSYAKSVNYKDCLNLNNHIIFIDIGFNKTSIISYLNDKILSLDVLPVGGNSITKDISKILKISEDKAENLKINFKKKENFLSGENFSVELLEKIIFARVEEILEMSVESIKLKSITSDHPKLILMGGGSRALDKEYKDKIAFANDMDLLEETMDDICNSGFKLLMELNKQEAVVVPKKQRKYEFFEKLFLFFK
jgi:cell division protein FtsA